MTGGLSLDAGLPGAQQPAHPLGSIVDAADRRLGEIGRREHRFAWLQDDAGAWIAVDAYYPGNRVVVLCHPDPQVRAQASATVPAHGLRLVVLNPAELMAGAELDVLDAGLHDAGWTPGPARSPALVIEHPATEPGRPVREALEPRQAEAEERFGWWVGFVLCFVVLLEAYLGAIVLAVNHGDVLLGFGVLLDACARVMGTVIAGHEGDHGVVWANMIVGSPVVAALALRSRP